MLAAAVPGSMPNVYTVSFSGSGDVVVAVYKVSVIGSITDAQIETMFNALVAAATTPDTLLSGEDTIAGSVRLGESKTIKI